MLIVDLKLKKCNLKRSWNGVENLNKEEKTRNKKKKWNFYEISFKYNGKTTKTAWKKKPKKRDCFFLSFWVCFVVVFILWCVYLSLSFILSLKKVNNWWRKKFTKKKVHQEEIPLSTKKIFKYSTGTDGFSFFFIFKPSFHSL